MLAGAAGVTLGAHTERCCDVVELSQVLSVYRVAPQPDKGLARRG